MVTFLPRCGRIIAAVMLVGSAARAQIAGPEFAPPAPGAGSIAPGPQIAPPGAGGAGASPAAMASARSGQTFTVNAMIGTVNGEPVFVLELLRPLDEKLRQLAGNTTTLADFRRDAMALIRSEWNTRRFQSVILAAAEASLTEQDRERVRIYMGLQRDELIKTHGGTSEAAAERALQAMGTSLQGELQLRRRRVLVDLYFNRTVWHKVQVTREMILREYNRDLQKWDQKAQVELFTITLPVSRWLSERLPGGELGPVMANPTAEQIRAAEEQALATAGTIIGDLRRGVEFARLAEDYNSSDPARRNGGRSEVIRGTMVNTQLEDYIFSLPANTLGDPQLSRDADFRKSSVVVVKVGRKQESRQVSFEEAEPEIKAALRNTLYRSLQEEEMMRLTAGASVEAVERNLDLALDAAVALYYPGR